MSKAKGCLSKYASSLYLLAAVACLCPAAAGAQPPDPTASDANNNTAAGTDALLDVTTGFSNTAIGFKALTSDISGDGNIAVGSFALQSNTTGVSNTAAGNEALVSNTTGNFNSAVGAFALFDNTTGGYNTAGSEALTFNTGGNANTATGYQALLSNTTGSFNTATGHFALKFNTSGGYNNAFGDSALYNNTIGGFGVAGGVEALFSNTTGSNNVALGYQALRDNETGNNNVAVGRGALARLKGTGNVALGFNAGRNTRSGNSNIYIGHPGINGNESRVTRIGTVQKEVFIAGIAGVPGNGAHVVVRANGQLGVVVSSARYKQDIKPLDDMAGKLAQLRPVSYRYKADPDALHYGLIAEEVAGVMPELVIRDGDNRPDSVQYMDLVPLLLQQWKAQQAENARQRELIARQEARLERDETELAMLRRTLATRLAARDGKAE